MQQTTILEKLKIIFEVSKSSPLIWAVLAILAVIVVAALTVKKKTLKNTISLYGLVYIAIVLVIIVLFGSSLGKLFDYMMDNFFVALYFPNAAIYLAAIIATNIILCYSVFNLKTNKLIKNINLVVYCILHYLLALVLSVITTENLDIFSKESIYVNKNVQALIELSSTIFIAWIIYLIIYKLVKLIQNKNKQPVAELATEKKKRHLPAYAVEIKAPKYVIAEPRKKKETTILAKQSQLSARDLKERELLEKKLFDMEKLLKEQNDYLEKSIQARKILEERIAYLERHQQVTPVSQVKQEIPVKQPVIIKNLPPKPAASIEDPTSKIMKSFENVLTLEDYKVLATMLKSKKRTEVAQEIKKATSLQEPPAIAKTSYRPSK